MDDNAFWAAFSIMAFVIGGVAGFGLCDLRYHLARKKAEGNGREPRDRFGPYSGDEWKGT